MVRGPLRCSSQPCGMGNTMESGPWQADAGPWYSPRKPRWVPPWPFTEGLALAACGECRKARKAREGSP